MRGTVVLFTGTYGFIRPENQEKGESDIYFYYKNLLTEDRKIFVGDYVEFDVSVNNGSKNAVYIKTVNTGDDERKYAIVDYPENVNELIHLARRARQIGCMNTYLACGYDNHAFIIFTNSDTYFSTNRKEMLTWNSFNVPDLERLLKEDGFVRYVLD